MSTNEVERRFTAGRVELRARKDTRTVGGYAAVFNRQSQNLGGFVEVVDPAFFNKSRGDGWPGVMARYNHEMLLGTTAARSLRLNIDDTGLDYETDLLDDADSDRVFKLVQRGDVSQSSFAFRVFEDDWGMSDQGFPQRTLLSGALVDVAPVDQPAYLDTSAGLRSLAQTFEADLEEVRSLAAGNDLTRFFKRSDTRPARRSAATALAHAKSIKI